MTTSSKKPVPKTSKAGQMLQPTTAQKLNAGRSARAGTTSFHGGAAEIIGAMREGTSARVVQDLARRVGVTQDGLFVALRLPASTMKARIGKNQPLSPLEQDRLYRADRVWSRALAVLEDEAAARLWINRSNRSLGGEAPLALLDTEAGYELVLDTLGRIEHGLVS